MNCLIWVEHSEFVRWQMGISVTRQPLWGRFRVLKLHSHSSGPKWEDAHQWIDQERENQDLQGEYHMRLGFGRHRELRLRLFEAEVFHFMSQCCLSGGTNGCELPLVAARELSLAIRSDNVNKRLRQGSLSRKRLSAVLFHLFSFF